MTGEMDGARRRLERRVTGDGQLPSRLSVAARQVFTGSAGELGEARASSRAPRIDGLTITTPSSLVLASAHWALGDVSACRAGSRPSARARGGESATEPGARRGPQSDRRLDHPGRSARRGGALSARDGAARRAGDVFQLHSSGDEAGTVLESRADTRPRSNCRMSPSGWPSSSAGQTRWRGRATTRARHDPVPVGRVLTKGWPTSRRPGRLWNDWLGSRTWALRNLGWAHRQRGAIAPARASLERALESAARRETSKSKSSCAQSWHGSSLTKTGREPGPWRTRPRRC